MSLACSTKVVLITKRIKILSTIILSLAAAILASLPGLAADSKETSKFSLAIEKAPPAVQRRFFDPSNPPYDLPRMNRGERGTTLARYGIVFNSSIEVVSVQEEGKRVTVTIAPKKIVIKLSLPIAIWVPHHSPEKLRVHEEGHRVIHESIYKDADILVRFYAETLGDSRYKATGASMEEAVKNAYRLIGEDLNTLYQRSVYDYSVAVGDEYDFLTAHGSNHADQEKAIETAFKRHRQYRYQFDEIIDYYKRLKQADRTETD